MHEGAAYASPDRATGQDYSSGLFLMGKNAIDFYLLLKNKSYLTIKSAGASDNFDLRGLDVEFNKLLQS
jgi:hypothetical protein